MATASEDSKPASQNTSMTEGWATCHIRYVQKACHMRSEQERITVNEPIRVTCVFITCHIQQYTAIAGCSYFLALLRKYGKVHRPGESLALARRLRKRAVVHTQHPMAGKLI